MATYLLRSHCLAEISHLASVLCRVVFRQVDRCQLDFLEAVEKNNPDLNSSLQISFSIAPSAI